MKLEEDRFKEWIAELENLSEGLDLGNSIDKLESKDNVDLLIYLIVLSKALEQFTNLTKEWIKLEKLEF